MRSQLTAVWSALFSLLLTVESHADWLSPAWQYRQPIQVTNAADPLVDHAVELSLQAPDFNFAHSTTDGADLRFTDSDGTTVLNFWIQEYNPVSGLARIWVKIPSLEPNETRTIFAYFGNSTASIASNGSATFPAFLQATQDFDVVFRSQTANLQRIERAPETPTPLISKGAVGEYDHWGFREHGNVLYEPNEPDPTRRFKTWYSAVADSIYSDRQTWLAEAVSADGYHWTKYGRVSLTYRGEDPYVVHVGDTYYLYYEGKLDTLWDTVSLMTSPDGLNWTYYGIVIPPNPNLDWMNRSPSSPTVWVDYGAQDTTWYMWFEGKGTGPNRGGGSIGLATSPDGLNWTVYGTTPNIELGSPGQWDSGAMVPDCIYQEGSLFWLIYHGHNNITPFRCGFAYSSDLIHWTKAPAISGSTAISESGDPQVFWDADGQLTATICLTNVYRGYLVQRDSAQWPYDSTWTLESRGGNFGVASAGIGQFHLSGESFKTSSNSLVSTQRWTNGFEVAVRARAHDYGSHLYSTIAIGAGNLVDMNLGGQNQWETTALQSGYLVWISNNAVLGRMPSTGGKVVLNSWPPSLSLFDDFVVQRFAYDQLGFLKWYVADTLRATVRDTVFAANSKRVLISQGELPASNGLSSDGGIEDIDWIMVRNIASPEPIVVLGTEESGCPITVMTPDTSTQVIGYPVSVQWSGSDGAGLVQIELDRSYPGGAWEMLVDSTLNDGEESISISGAPSAHCRIRVTCRSTGTGDTSNADFSLVMPQTVMSLPVSVTAINGCAPDFHLYVAASFVNIEDFSFKYVYDTTLIRFDGSSVLPDSERIVLDPFAVLDTLVIEGHFASPGTTGVDTLLELFFQVLSDVDTTLSFDYAWGEGTWLFQDSLQNVSFIGSSSQILVDATPPLAPEQVTMHLLPEPDHSLRLDWAAVTQDANGNPLVSPLYSVYSVDPMSGDTVLIGSTLETYFITDSALIQDPQSLVLGQFLIRACKTGS